MARYRDPGFRRKPNLIFSVFLIAAGIVLFLANLGLLPFSVHEVWGLWPLIFVAIGLGRIARTGRPSAVIVGGMLAMFGVIFTLVNIGVIRIHIHDDSWPLSLLFIALGIGGLVKVLESGNPRWRQSGFSASKAPDSDPERQPPWPTRENWAGWSKTTDVDDSPALDITALMASIKRKVETNGFQGGTLMTFWGSIELDLRRAFLPEGHKAALLDANVLMGSIKLRVPETWRVSWNGLNIMANFEDRTIPPISGAAAPELIITGHLMMGSIEIES